MPARNVTVQSASFTSSSRSRRAGRVPAYRQRPGYTHGITTLTDAVTGRRRDFWLGEFNTPESRERYFRLIALWESQGRRLAHIVIASSGGSGCQ